MTTPLTRSTIYGLNDLELAQAMGMMAKDAPSSLRTNWERGFANGLEGVYVTYGGLTWKQRCAARDLLCRLVTETQRRADVRSEPEKVE